MQTQEGNIHQGQRISGGYLSQSETAKYFK